MFDTIPALPAATLPSRRGRRWLWLLAVPPALVALASWWFTEPLGPPPSPGLDHDAVVAEVPPPPPALEWPALRLDGEPAKRLLLKLLLADRKELEAVDGYTATFRKEERIRGRLEPEQTIRVKFRHRPFAVYMKFLKPSEGKEVVYAEGRHDNKMIAHAAGLGRMLVPRLKVAPTDRLALAENRHPITEAGLLNLVNKLVGFRELDLKDPEAVTILDRTVDDQGRAWLRSVHLHPHYHPERPFARVEVLYDPQTKLPLRITSYDWPAPGQTGDLLVAERYSYEDLKLDAPLDDLDFDPANPAYAFHRF
jgi:hypothetical protein